jgi:hypothetical protein
MHWGILIPYVHYINRHNFLDTRIIKYQLQNLLTGTATHSIQIYKLKFPCFMGV